MTELVDHDGGQDHAEHRQRSQEEDDPQDDVHNRENISHNDGEAGLAVDGLCLH